jgi:FkbM family methyltransferase
MTASRAARISGWFDDGALVACLPWLWRGYAAYSRAMVNRRTGLVRGGSFLFRLLRRAAPRLSMPDAVRVRVGARSAWVDLRDQRCLWVFDELRGTGLEAGVLARLLAPGDTFLDVGANHGSFSVLAAERVGPRGRIVAVEPQPRLAALVERSLGEQAAAPFEVHAVALGDHSASVTLHVPETGSGAASVFGVHGDARGRAIAVPLRRADDHLNWPSWPGRLTIKLDVEGSELDFLAGARELLATRRPAILLELSPETARWAGRTPGDAIAALESLGYTQFAELERFPQAVTARELDLSSQRNIVALRDDR